MRTIDKFFTAVGGIGTAGAIVSGFLGQRVASLIMLASLFLVWQVWLTMEIIILRNAAAILGTQSNIRPRLSYLKDPLIISSARMNPLKISADFMLWSECTVMLWVQVPPKGQGLRDSPNNRYLLAHHTGKAEQKNEAYRNQFVLRHSSTHHRWEFLTSDGSAKYGSSLVANDGLEPGWHHFLISWDRTRPRTVFLIDGGSGGSDVSNASFERWPEQVDKLFVGTWVSEWSGHFCEARLLQLNIFDRFLTANAPEVRDSLRLKPRA